MPMYSPNSLLLNTIKNYFAHLNPIAQKIANDIDSTQSAYGDLWFTLSDNEKNDIINETLINPNISLQYYNINFTPSTTIKTTADDSLHTIFLREPNYRCFGSQKNHKQEEPNSSSSIKNTEKCYSFDGRNLRTYALQRVGQKVVQDEILGIFRDEHSIPFSYRTKSQINLLNKEINLTEHADCNDEKPLTTYYKSPKEFHQKIHNPLNVNINSTMNQDKNICNSIKFLENSKTKNKKVLECCSNNSIGTYVRLPNKDNEIIRTKMQPTYADTICSEKYSSFENDEYANLMSNYVGSDSIATSIFSAASSEDDQFDADEQKLLCEEVGLLDNDTNLRKGFDFLKNW